MSHHVTCHVTSLSCAFFIILKKKKKKYKIKRKIDKRKNKMLGPKHSITERPIDHIVEVNIYDQEYRERE